MPLSLYQTAIPSFTRGLHNLTAVLAKAEAHAKDNNIDLTTYVNARLAPDMLPLSGQIQAVSDAAKFGTARLAQVAPPSFADTETTFEDLYARITKTLDFIATVSEAQMNANEGGTVTLKVAGKETTFSSGPYLLGFVLPNFYFHITTAYGILRHHGVGLGKLDFLGDLASLQAA